MDTEVNEMTDKDIRQELARTDDRIAELLKGPSTSAEIMHGMGEIKIRYDVLEAELKRRGTVPA